MSKESQSDSFMSPVFSFPYSRHRCGSGEVLDVILSKALIWFCLYRTQRYGNVWVSVCLFSSTPSPRLHPSTRGLPLVFRSLWAFSRSVNDEQQKTASLRIHFIKFAKTSTYIGLSWCVLLFHSICSLHSLVEHWGLLFIFCKFTISGMSSVCRHCCCVACLVWKTNSINNGVHSITRGWNVGKKRVWQIISKWIKGTEHFQIWMACCFLSC